VPTWFKVVVLIVWVAVGHQTLSAEVESIRKLPTLWALDAHAQKRRIDGPLYEFVQRVQEHVPLDQAPVVSMFAADGYTYLKVSSYLYPTTIRHLDPAHLSSQDLPIGGYFLVYFPSRLVDTTSEVLTRDWNAVAAKLPPMREVYRASNMGIYQVAVSQ